jgi:hypothetical protein
MEIDEGPAKHLEIVVADDTPDNTQAEASAYADAVLAGRLTLNGGLNSNSNNNNNNNSLAQCMPAPHIDWSWGRRVIELQNQERQAGYQLACLSTLGGGYFLCNQHKVALVIAHNVLRLGYALNNTALTVRSLTYIAVNFKLLGQDAMASRVFATAFDKAKDSKDLTEMCQSSQFWLRDFEIGMQMRRDRKEMNKNKMIKNN